jgi:hypothetical protein
MVKRSSVVSIVTKKGVSEMMSYTLIIMLVLGLSVFVYAYLTLNAPKDRTVCSDDISLVMRQASCSIILEQKPACGIIKPTLDFTALLENKGNHKIDGAYLRLGQPENEVKELLNQNKLFFTLVSGGISTKGLQPGARWTFATQYENPETLTPGNLDLEIQPFVGTPEKFSVCEQSVVMQSVTCQKGNILPRVSISASAPQGYVISDSSPSSVSFTVTASDCDGTIVKAELLERSASQAEGSENLYTLTGAGPYTFIRPLSSTDYTAGDYVYTAVAYDDKGAKGISQPLPLQYTRNAPPSVTLEILNANKDAITQSTSRDKVFLRARASDPEGAVESVDFYELFDSLGGAIILLGRSTSGSDGVYEFELGPRSVGDHKFVAYAFDSLKTSARSSEKPLNVIRPQLPQGAPVFLEAGAISAADGTAKGKVSVRRGTETLINECETKCKAEGVVVRVGEELQFEAAASTTPDSFFSGWGGLFECKEPRIAPGTTKLATCTFEVREDVSGSAMFAAPCTETDTGDDPRKAGTTTQGSTSRVDVCTQVGLAEYYCKDNQINEKSYRCSSCNSGVCNNPTPA